MICRSRGGVVALQKLRRSPGDGRAGGWSTLAGDTCNSAGTIIPCIRYPPGRGLARVRWSQSSVVNKAFAFDESDNLYVNVGAPSLGPTGIPRATRFRTGPVSSQRVRQASVWRSRRGHGRSNPRAVGWPSNSSPARGAALPLPRRLLAQAVGLGPHQSGDLARRNTAVMP